MTKNPTKAAGEEISPGRLLTTVPVLVAGAMLMDLLPLLNALRRLGQVGAAMLVAGIVIAAIAFFRAYEYLTPTSPPTPRRDLAVILFAALLIGLWTFLLTNLVVTVVVLVAAGAFVLLPEAWRQRMTDRLPWS